MGEATINMKITSIARVRGKTGGNGSCLKSRKFKATRIILKRPRWPYVKRQEKSKQH